MPTFTKGLKKNKNKDLIRSLYLSRPKNIDSTMARAKVHMLTDEGLDLSEDEE